MIITWLVYTAMGWDGFGGVPLTHYIHWLYIKWMESLWCHPLVSQQTFGGHDIGLKINHISNFQSVWKRDSIFGLYGFFFKRQNYMKSSEPIWFFFIPFRFRTPRKCNPLLIVFPYWQCSMSAGPAGQTIECRFLVLPRWPLFGNQKLYYTVNDPVTKNGTDG